MKNRTSFKTQNAIVVFVLAVACLNATEQRDGAQSAHQDSTMPLEAQESDTLLTKGEMINRLSRGMDGYHNEALIDAIGNVSPDHYTEEFISAVNQLLQRTGVYGKIHIIEVLGKINPEHYSAFINTVNQLSQGMGSLDTLKIIEPLGKISPDHYSSFIRTVHQFSQGMGDDCKAPVIITLGKINSELHPFLLNFINQNPYYFKYVPVCELFEEITPDMNQQQLQDLLQRFYRNYYHRAPAATHKE